MTRRPTSARAPWSPASAGVRCPRGPERSGRGSVASMSSRSVPRGELDEVVVGGRVGAVGHAPAAVGRAHVDRPRGQEVRHRVEADAQRADLELVLLVVLGHLEGVLDVVLEHPAAAADPAHRRAPARGHVQARARGAVGARPAVDRDRLLARRVGQPRGERDEVEDVVGVQVADHHGVDARVVAEAPQLGEDAVAAVQQQARVALLDEVAAAGPVGVLPGGGFAQNRDAQRACSSADPCGTVPR